MLVSFLLYLPSLDTAQQNKKLVEAFLTHPESAQIATTTNSLHLVSPEKLHNDLSVQASYCMHSLESGIYEC